MKHGWPNKVLFKGMQRKHIITISGKPGSGKSSTADRVAELLSYTRYSSGDFVRDMTRKQKITLTAFNEIAEKNPEIHPYTLRNKVTSPGGTTIFGLEALEKGNFTFSVIDAVFCAFERAKELGKK